MPWNTYCMGFYFPEFRHNAETSSLHIGRWHQIFSVQFCCQLWCRCMSFLKTWKNWKRRNCESLLRTSKSSVRLCRSLLFLFSSMYVSAPFTNFSFGIIHLVLTQKFLKNYYFLHLRFFINNLLKLYLFSDKYTYT